jgi:aldose 1-epimerase
MKRFPALSALFTCAAIFMGQTRPTLVVPDSAIPKDGLFNVPFHGARASEFGELPDGAAVKIFKMVNSKMAVAQVTDYGAIIVALEMPDRNGKMANVVLGTDTVSQLLRFPNQAQTVGRVASRIAGAKFTLDGKEYTTEANNGPNTLHSGRANFGTHLWQAKIPDPSKPSVQMTYISKDGDGGFPGTLTTTVTFTLTENNEFRLDYQATTDKATPINFTNHAYFNLSGAGSGNILDHEVWIDADKYTVADNALIPTGEIAPVKDKPWDFTKPTAVGARIAQLGGRAPTYDHSFVLNSGGKANPDGSLPIVARVTDPKSGRILECRTDQPGLQLYTGNAQHPGLTLETQHFPDSVHHESFPTTVLKPGDIFKSTTIYAFSAR